MRVVVCFRLQQLSHTTDVLRLGHRGPAGGDPLQPLADHHGGAAQKLLGEVRAEETLGVEPLLSRLQH